MKTPRKSNAKKEKVKSEKTKAPEAKGPEKVEEPKEEVILPPDQPEPEADIPVMPEPEKKIYFTVETLEAFRDFSQSYIGKLGGSHSPVVVMRHFNELIPLFAKLLDKINENEIEI